MPDQPYQTFNFVLASKGISARHVDDQISEGFLLNEKNLEEISEGSVSTRLGSTLVNKTGAVVNALPGPVHSLAKLTSLNGISYRYAGCGTGLYRRQGLTPGPYTLISNNLSGKPWQAVVYRPEVSSKPTIFFADANGMLKDDGTLAAPQQSGIFQPQYPVQAQVQIPYFVTLDNYDSILGTYTYTGISGGTVGHQVNTTTTTAITVTGIQAVSITNPQQVSLFQTLAVGTGPAGEFVMVISVTATGFVANFNKLHVVGTDVISDSLQVVVPASTTATISWAFGGVFTLPFHFFPVPLEQADYIGIQIYVSDPAQISKITLKFDCGDGTFNTDYFYKIIGQGPLQALLDVNTNSATSAADVVLATTLGVYGKGASGISQLNTGLNQWTPVLIQLSDFAASGRADFNDLIFNWKAVNGYQLEIVTNANASVTVQMASLLVSGGPSPDSFAGTSYDYLATFYNIVDGTESNPSMTMTDVNPPNLTNFVLPRRQPVKLTITHPVLDPQTTHLRIYRRGGTLKDTYRRIDQIPCLGAVTTYTDLWSDLDIQQADPVSFLNDVPVTATLPVPVNTTLTVGIATVNAVVSVFPASMANVFVAQQVDLGNVIAANFEVVIVLTVAVDHFTAFVQNTHLLGEIVAATAKYGQPVTIMQQANQRMYYAGDFYNPSYLYQSAASNPQAVASNAYTEVSTPDDAITIIALYKGNLYCSTVKLWWSLAIGGGNQTPTPYPTSADRGGIAPLGFCRKGDLIPFMALDGLRVFNGGGTTDISNEIRYVWQGIGATPIPVADQTQLGKTILAFWNEFVFVSYIALDGNRYRIVLDIENKRFRNETVDAQSMMLEADTNTMIYGDSQGLIHQDRQDLAYDEGSLGGNVTQIPIAFNLQTPYANGGTPQLQKNYNELVLDLNTNGVAVTPTLFFNDGAITEVFPPVSTVLRQRINLNLNNGNGTQALKVSLQLTGSGTSRIFLYQAALRSIQLAQTRQSYDSYHLTLGTPESKLARMAYYEYTASADITAVVFYDASVLPDFAFTLPYNAGLRTSFRTRLPAKKFRTIRIVMVSTADFMMWSEGKLDFKVISSGKGWSVAPLLT